MIALVPLQICYIAAMYTECLNAARRSGLAKPVTEGRLMLYAAYGSNLHPVRLTERTSSARLLGTISLPNWSLCFHKRGDDGSGKCSIVAGGDAVHFAIFDISAEDKLMLDEIEGLGHGYSEISLSMPGIGCCVSYVAEEPYIDESLQPYDWYKELVVAGAKYHGFGDRYLNKIEQVQALRDPDAARMADQFELVERLARSPGANPLE